MKPQTKLPKPWGKGVFLTRASSLLLDGTQSLDHRRLRVDFECGRWDQRSPATWLRARGRKFKCRQCDHYYADVDRETVWFPGRRGDDGGGTGRYEQVRNGTPA